MKKVALIIGSPAGTLQGAYYDLKNYVNYFKSPTGGTWQDYEIIPLENPTKARLLNTIKKISADYVLTIFSGHGGTSRVNKETEKFYLVKTSNMQEFKPFMDSNNYDEMRNLCEPVNLDELIETVPI